MIRINELTTNYINVAIALNQEYLIIQGKDDVNVDCYHQNGWNHSSCYTNIPNEGKLIWIMA